MANRLISNNKPVFLSFPNDTGGSTIEMIRWQYKTLTYTWDEKKKDLVWGDTKELVVNAEMVDQRLNELGELGWELLCVEKISNVSHIAVSFYLKRPKETENRPHLETSSTRLPKKTSVEQTNV